MRALGFVLYEIGLSRDLHDPHIVQATLRLDAVAIELLVLGRLRHAGQQNTRKHTKKNSRFHDSPRKYGRKPSRSPPAG